MHGLQADVDCRLLAPTVLLVSRPDPIKRVDVLLEALEIGPELQTLAFDILGPDFIAAALMADNAK